MRIRSLTYTMLRKTAPFENDRAEITIDLEPDDVYSVVVEQAKKLCEEALGKKREERKYGNKPLRSDPIPTHYGDRW